MRRLELLIASARSESLNREYSTSIGIPQDDFVRWANEAQDRAFSEINKTHPKYFTAEKIITAVANQEAYSLPAAAFIGQMELVEYSYDSSEANYRRLEQLKLPERMSNPSGHPAYYISRNAGFLSAPAPAAAGGSFRVTYIRKPKRLDIRRGGITSRTFSAPTLTALTLANITTLDPSDQINSNNYLSVVDRNGSQVMAGIEYDSVSTGTGVVTITGSSFTAQTGETITTSNYVVIGQDAANLSDLPDLCDRYILKWMVYKAFERDGSQLAGLAKKDCDEILVDITTSFADKEHDVSSVTILNNDFMDFGDFIG
jgi:hypothetical protein